MLKLRDQFPRYLLGKHQLILTVLFAAFFSLVFLLVSIPFSNNAWFKLGGGEVFLFTAFFYLISLSVVVFSKMGMYLMRSSANFTFFHYLLWNFGEVLLLALLYTFFTIEGARFGILDLEEMNFWRLLLSAVVYSTISLGIPYALASLNFVIEEKDNTIRLMNYGNVAGDALPAPGGDKRITLFDNGGALKFSVFQDNLYFIEADDNYIQVWYTDRTGELKKYMLRCRLKTIEESFSDSDLVRCHRKYIVNIRKVRLLSAGREGYTLELEQDGVPVLPVSKTYEQAVLARFNSRS